MNLGYRWCVDDSAYDSLASLRKRHQRQVTAIIREIAAHPFHAPAFTTTDSDGFEVGVHYGADCMITYRVDHAVRLVHIQEISSIS